MHTFNVVKERHGWAVRIGDGMTTPFWTKALAVREAHSLCEDLRRHGVASQVVVEEQTAAANERLQADWLQPPLQ